MNVGEYNTLDLLNDILGGKGKLTSIIIWINGSFITKPTDIANYFNVEKMALEKKADVIRVPIQLCFLFVSLSLTYF